MIAWNKYYYYYMLIYQVGETVKYQDHMPWFITTFKAIYVLFGRQVNKGNVVASEDGISYLGSEGADLVIFC